MDDDDGSVIMNITGHSTHESLIGNSIDESEKVSDFRDMTRVIINDDKKRESMIFPPFR